MKGDILDQWLSENRRPVDPQQKSRYTVGNDSFERQMFEDLLEQLPEFSAMRQRLRKAVEGKVEDHELPLDIWQDNLLALWKVRPEVLEGSEIRPTRAVNRAIMEEMFELPELRTLRRWTTGDDVSAAMSVNELEPKIEELYDRMEQQQKDAQALEDALAALGAAMDHQADVEKMWAEAQGAGEGEDGEGQGDGEGRAPIDWNKELADAQEAVDQARGEAEAAAQSLQTGLRHAAPAIRHGLREALEEINDQVDGQQVMASSWGMSPGELRRLPPDQRIELARRMNTPKMRRIAERIGAIKRMAMSEQRRKVSNLPHEVYDIETGNNLARLLPSQLLLLGDELTETLFYKGFVEHSLHQYKLRGTEMKAKGGIIYVYDGSGSMQGEREVWTKAIGGALLAIARKQKRPFYAIQFGSKGQQMVHDFRDIEKVRPEQVLDFFEFFYNGGTWFEEPLNMALAELQSEWDQDGATKGDIVFATDGQAPVTPEWMEAFKKEQDRLGFKVYGMAIGAEPEDEPLHTICDGRVMTIRDLTSGEDVRDLFRRL